jgi:hypothetical protein
MYQLTLGYLWHSTQGKYVFGFNEGTGAFDNNDDGINDYTNIADEYISLGDNGVPFDSWIKISSHVFRNFTDYTKGYVQIWLQDMTTNDTAYFVRNPCRTIGINPSRIAALPLNTHTEEYPNQGAVFANGFSLYSGGLDGSMPNPCSLFVDNATFEITPLPQAATSTALIITNMDAGNWLFAESEYYIFNAQIEVHTDLGTLSSVSIRFSDGLTWITATYNYTSDTYQLDTGTDKAQLLFGTETWTNSITLNVTFPIYLTNEILDAYNVDLYMMSTDDALRTVGWEEMQSDYCNIYNHGGQFVITSSGDAGRLAGGDVFDLYATNGSWVEASIAFKNLQHVKMLPMISWLSLGDDWNVSFSLAYYANGSWLEGFKLQIKQYIYVAGSLRYDFVKVNWFLNEESITTDNVYCYYVYTGEVNTNLTMQLWFDLWFNKVNASSLIGGRVNAYYYPMKDSANEWLRWLTGANWGIYEQLPKESMKFATMKDNNNNTVYASEIEMVKLVCRLEVPTYPNQTVFLSNFNIFDLTFGPSPLEGIQTPVFDETKVVVMPQGGFLGAIATALANLNRWFNIVVGTALLGYWTIFQGFVDSIFTYFGYPGAFSNFISWLGALWGWLADSFSWLITALTSTFILLGTFMTKLLNTIATAFGIFANMIQMIFGLLGGAYGAGTNIWETLGMSTWVMLFFILYPIYLLALWETRGFDAMINHLRGIFDILMFIGNIILSVIRLTTDLIFRMIESVPVAE